MLLKQHLVIAHYRRVLDSTTYFHSAHYSNQSQSHGLKYLSVRWLLFYCWLVQLILYRIRWCIKHYIRTHTQTISNLYNKSFYNFSKIIISVECHWGHWDKEFVFLLGGRRSFCQHHTDYPIPYLWCHFLCLYYEAKYFQNLLIWCSLQCNKWKFRSWNQIKSQKLMVSNWR